MRSIEEIAQQQKGGAKEEGETGSVQASYSHKAGKTRDFRQPSQALKEGKTLEMLTVKNHTGGGYRTDVVMSLALEMSFQIQGTALLYPMAAISIIFQRVPYLLES